ncbi:MAG: hypothetical protein ACREP7_02870, partial [Lysobacter sp.]
MLRKTLSNIAAFALLTLGCSAAADAALVQTVRYANFQTNQRVQVETAAWCQAGEIATGGGHTMSYGEDVFVYANAPTSNGALQGWRFRFIATAPAQQPTVIGAVYV